MRFMILVKADKASEAGVLPDERSLARMGEFNQELAEAGVLLEGEGLQPSAKGVRVNFSGGKRTVVQGPFVPPDELVAGFWLWQADSLQEAVDWAKRAPFYDCAEVEIRQVLEAEDFGPEFTRELREQEEELRAQVAARK